MIHAYIDYETFTTVSFRNGNLIVLTTPWLQKHAHILGSAFSKAFKNIFMVLKIKLCQCQEFCHAKNF